MIVSTAETIPLADWVIEQYGGIQGNNGIYYHTSDLPNSAQDNSYRYSGTNPNNYVCFGSTATPCPSGNLYRIIGVFDGEVKLIKSTSYGNYAWDEDWNTNWNANRKPSIYAILNSTYLNSLENSWSEIIATHNYKVGGLNTSNGENTPRRVYNYEVGSNQTGYVESMKIGLMYISDYGYAVSNDYWTTNLSDYNDVTSSNWLYYGSNEWTISRIKDEDNFAFFVVSSGNIVNSIYYAPTSRYIVRPVFYLNSNVECTGGTATSTDPLRIKLN